MPATRSKLRNKRGPIVVTSADFRVNSGALMRDYDPIHVVGENGKQYMTSTSGRLRIESKPFPTKSLFTHVVRLRDGWNHYATDVNGAIYVNGKRVKR